MYRRPVRGGPDGGARRRIGHPGTVDEHELKIGDLARDAGKDRIVLWQVFKQ